MRSRRRLVCLPPTRVAGLRPVEPGLVGLSVAGLLYGALFATAPASAQAPSDRVDVAGIRAESGNKPLRFASGA